MHFYAMRCVVCIPSCIEVQVVHGTKASNVRYKTMNRATLSFIAMAAFYIQWVNWEPCSHLQIPG